MENNAVSLLKTFVAIPSAYPGEQAFADSLYSLLKKEGVAVRKQHIGTGRYNVLAERGTGKKSLLLYSHLDTVGIAKGWKTNPHILCAKGDKAYGLGAWDMKSGLAASLSAFMSVPLRSFKLKFVACADEENISTGGHLLAKSPFMKDVHAVISTEPAFYNGLQGIVTGRIGRAVYDGVLSGKSIHYAFYHPSRDVSVPFAEFVAELQKLYKESGEKKQFVFVRKSESQAIGMSLPETVSFQLDTSVVPPHTHGSIASALKKITSRIEKKYGGYFSFDISLHERPTPFLEPYESPVGTKLYKSLAGSIRQITGKPAIPYFRSSVADENIFGSLGIPTYGLGPVGGNAHGANEWVSLRSVAKLEDILSHFISTVDGL